MRRPLHLAIGIACFILGSPAGAGQVPDRDAETEAAAAVEDALEEPSDPDDEMDVRADDDPNDVGQRALESAGSEETSDDPPR